MAPPIWGMIAAPALGGADFVGSEEGLPEVLPVGECEAGVVVSCEVVLAEVDPVDEGFEVVSVVWPVPDICVLVLVVPGQKVGIEVVLEMALVGTGIWVLRSPALGARSAGESSIGEEISSPRRST